MFHIFHIFEMYFQHVFVFTFISIFKLIIVFKLVAGNGHDNTGTPSSA